MESLFTILSGMFSSVFTAMAFRGANLAFSMLTDHGKEERKRHDLALEKLQKARDEQNQDRQKRLDLIKKRLRERNETRAYIKDADEAMLEYYCVFSKKIKPLPPEPELSDFYHPSETKKKMVKYYLLQWVQVLQHMPYTITLNK